MAFHPHTDGQSEVTRRMLENFLRPYVELHPHTCRFHLRASTRCLWCGAAQDDREYRLFECPRFEYTRQALATEIEQATHGTSRWSWDFLLHDGRPYLAKFLRRVRAAPIPPEEEEDFEDAVDAT